jgi:hypothetical protein
MQTEKKKRSGDKTLPNFIKRKHPTKGREEETRGQGPKVQASKTAQKRRATTS